MEENAIEKPKKEYKYKLINIGIRSYKQLEELKNLKFDTMTNILRRLIEDEYNKVKKEEETKCNIDRT